MWKTAVALVLLLIACIGCGSPRGTLVIGTDAVFPPFHYVDSSAPDGVTGYDIELARLAARRAGYQPRVVREPEYAALFERLERGEFDLVAATTGITPERRRRFLFTRPYFTTCQAVMVRRGEREPRRIAELRGVAIACSPGGTSEAAARAVGAGAIVPLENERGGVEALLEGHADAYIADEFDIISKARGSDRVRILREPAAIEQYGFVLPLQNVRDRDAINRALEALEREGEIARLQARFKLRRAQDWPVKLPSQ